MKSLSATEISKMGKCEVLVMTNKQAANLKTRKYESLKNAKEKARGDAAHLRYEKEVVKYKRDHIRNIDGKLINLIGVLVMIMVAAVVMVG